MVFIKIIEKYILLSKVAGFLRKMDSKYPLLFGKVLLHTLRVFFFFIIQVLFEIRIAGFFYQIYL